MSSRSVTVYDTGIPSEELLSSLVDIVSAGLRQVTRGLCLGLIGFGVILSVAAVLIGVAELGVGTTGPPLPPEQILHL